MRDHDERDGEATEGLDLGADVRWERNRLTQAFAGHSHYTRCTIKYDTAGTRYSKNWACTETIDVYLLPHNSDRNRTIFMHHLTNACGYKLLKGPRPS